MPIWLFNLLVLVGCAAVAWLLRAVLFTERSRRATQRLRRDRLGLVCAAVVGLFLLAGLSDCLYLDARTTLLDAAFRNVATEESYSAPFARTTFDERDPQPLRGFHLLGTDLLGKDVLKQTLKGCKTALIIGGLTTALYVPVGALLGILGAYFRRWVDDAVQYLYSTMASIPGILLLVAVMMIWKERALYQMSIALSLTAWIGLCRLVRGETFRQAARPYVDAARALGQSHPRIILFHILPNVMHLVVINAILGFSGLVLTETILSYLGVGAPVGTASWGLMIDSARMELSRDPAVWWPLVSATSALFLLVLSLNLLSDSLRRAFDPKAA